jgi:hypothetical protein
LALTPGIRLGIHDVTAEIGVGGLSVVSRDPPQAPDLTADGEALR